MSAPPAERAGRFARFHERLHRQTALTRERERRSLRRSFAVASLGHLLVVAAALLAAWLLGGFRPAAPRTVPVPLELGWARAPDPPPRGWRPVLVPAPPELVLSAVPERDRPAPTPDPMLPHEPPLEPPPSITPMADDEPLPLPPLEVTLIPATAASLAADRPRPTAAVAPAAPAPSADRPARPLAARNHPPVYPESARREGQAGTVVLRLAVRADGSVGEVRVTRSSGFPLLDRAAERTLRNWRFEPARAGGQPIECRLEQAVTFRLERPE